MNKLLSVLVILTLTFSCKGQSGKLNDVKQQTVKSDSLPDSLSNSTYEIRKVSTSFYDWYLKSIKSVDANVPIDIEVIEGENGKCKVDYEPYFNQLRKLKTISTKFMDNECKRTKSCAEFMKKVDWKNYQNSEAYDYEDSCNCFSNFYWIQSQDQFDGVEIVDLTKNGEAWFAKLQLYIDFEGKRTYIKYMYPKVKMEMENGNWMITEITVKENI